MSHINLGSNFASAGRLLINFIVGILLFFPAGIKAQVNPPSYYTPELRSTQNNVPVFHLPEVNVDSLKKAAGESNCETCRDGGVWGYNNSVKVDLLKDGYKAVLPNGDRIYRYSFSVSYAYSLQVHFDTCKIPDGAELFVYSADKKTSTDAITSKNNPTGRWYATKPIPGNHVTVEYYVPAHVNDLGVVGVGLVVADFMDLYRIAVNVKVNYSIAACTDNVICKQGSVPYYDEMVKSVGMLLRPSGVNNSSYSGYCSGTLVNNSKSDGTPYFMSARHCVNPDYPETYLKYVALFDFESTTCEGNYSSAKNAKSLSGIQVLSADDGQKLKGDYALLKIVEKPPVKMQLCFASWNAEAKAVLAEGENKVAVHHASADVKRMSITSKEVLAVDASRNVDANGYWYKVRWSGDGVTYKGASGSALFNKDGEYIGNLNGGSSFCKDTTIEGEDVSPNYSDRYGRFSKYFVDGNFLPYLAPNWTAADLKANNYKVPAYCPYKEYPNTCFNGVKDFLENDVDCGGNCPPCDLAFEQMSLQLNKDIFFLNEEVQCTVTKNFSGAEYTYEWLLGPSSSLGVFWGNDHDFNPPPFTYNTAGVKNIILNVYKNSTMILTQKIQPFIGNPSTIINPRFEVSDASPDVSEYITLTPTDISSDVTRFYWDFGPDVVCGPEEKNKEIPRVSWSKEGPRDITLTIFMADNTVSRWTFFNAVSVYRTVPKYFAVDFDVQSPIDIDYGATFMNTSTWVSPANAGVTALWDFGDESITTDWSPRHDYLSEGTYKVSLTICAYENCKSTSKMVEVKSSASYPTFVINDITWAPGDCYMSYYYGKMVCDPQPDPPVEVGMNTMTKLAFINNTKYILRDSYWNFNLGSVDPEDNLLVKHNSKVGGNGSGEQYHNFKTAGTYTVLHTSPSAGSSIFNKATTVKVVPGQGATGCAGRIDQYSLSTTCWNGKAPEFTVSLKETVCAIDFRIVGSRSGEWPRNKTKVDYFNESTVFPYTETFFIQAVQWDGVKCTVLDETEATYTFKDARAIAGEDQNVCPGTALQLGTGTRAGKQYYWEATPSSAASFFSDTRVSNPTVTITTPGNYRFVFAVKDLSSGCVGYDAVLVNVSPITVSESTAEVSKGEGHSFSSIVSGGAGAYSSYAWNPATALSNVQNTSATFDGVQVPGTYVYILTATDNNGCMGSGKHTVHVSATAPSGLIASANVSKLWLTWVDNAEDETEYKVLRSSTLNGSYTQIASLPPNSIYFLDPNTVFGVEYFYRIQAFKDDKNLGLSNKARGIRELESSPSRVINGTADFLGREVKALPDGGYVIVGKRNYKFAILLIDKCGKTVWQKTFESKYGTDDAYNVTPTPDGGFLVVGKSSGDPGFDRSQTNGACFCKASCTDWYVNNGYSKAGDDFWAIKISKNGALQWEKSYRGFLNDVATEIIPTSDGGYLIGGYSDYYASSEYNDCLEKGDPLIKLPNGKVLVRPVGVNYEDYWVVKINSSGSLQWEKYYGSHGYDNLKKLVELPDHSILLLGDVYGIDMNYYTKDNPTNLKAPQKGSSFVWMVKIDANGTQLLDKTYGGANAADGAQFADFISMPDGTYRLYANVSSGLGNDITIEGRGGSDYWCFELNANFEVTKSYRFGGSGTDQIMHVEKTANTLTMYGFSDSPVSGDKQGSSTGIWMVKTDYHGNKLEEVVFPKERAFKTFKIEEGLYHVFYNTKDGYVDYETYNDPEVYKPLQTEKLAQLEYYVGDLMTVPFVAKGCFDASNIYTLQLSDENGSFESGRNLTTITGAMLNGYFTVEIPYDVIPGNAYRVRVISSAPQYNGWDNGEYITIKSPEIITKKVTPLSYLPGSTIRVPFIVKGNFKSDNQFKVQLSDVNGSFVSATTLGVFTGSTSTTYTVTLPANTTWSDQYRVRVVSFYPQINGSDNEENIRIGALFTNNPWQTEYVKGQQIYITYEALAAFNSGNVFTLQLSDASGSFASPTVIGTSTYTTSGSIVGIIPVNAATGVHYKVRVVASDPAITGYAITNEISIVPQQIFTYSISPLQYTVSETMDVYYSANGMFNTDNEFEIQLSDENGDFLQPVVLQKVAGINYGRVSVTLPDFVPAGTQYRVRVVSTSPVIVGSDNGEDITIAPLFTGKVNPLAYNAGENISIPVITRYNFNTDNVFTAELSDEHGDFSKAIVIGSLQGTTQGTISAILPSVLTPATGYRVRVRSTSPKFVALDNKEDITINPPSVILDNVNKVAYCRTNPLAFNYTASGNFAADNNFILQLSDINGSFAHPTVLGFNPSSESDTVFATILDSALQGGLNYKIRLVSSHPVVVSNEVPIEIQNTWITSNKEHVICTGESLRLQTYLAAGHTAVWYKGDQMFSKGGAYIDVADSGLYKVVVTDPLGCADTSKPFGVLKFETPVVTVVATPNIACENVNISEEITWIPISNVMLDESKKIATLTAGQAKVTSHYYLDGDGSVSYPIGANVIFGLSNTQITSSSSSNSIKYALQSMGGEVYMWVNGATICCPYITYKNGDVLKIERKGSLITYYKNNTKIYTVSNALTSRLYINAIITSAGSLSGITINKPQAFQLSASVANATNPYTLRWYNSSGDLAGNVNAFNYTTSSLDPVTVELKTTHECGDVYTGVPYIDFQPTNVTARTIEVFPDNKICAPAAISPEWINLSNVSVTNGVISKSNSSASWNAGALGKSVVAEGQYLQMQVKASVWALGLSYVNNASHDYLQTEYAFVRTSTGTLVIYEKGKPVKTVSPFANNDVLSVGIESGYVVYYRNKLKIYTSVNKPSAALYPDIAMYNNTQTLSISVVKRNLKKIQVDNVDCTAGVATWYINGVAVDNASTNNSSVLASLASAMFAENDVVSFQYVSNGVCDNKILSPQAVKMEKEIIIPQITIQLTPSSPDKICNGLTWKNIEWVSLRNATVNAANTLLSNSGTTGSAFSSALIRNGGLEYKIHDLTDTRTIGLSASYLNNSRSSIPYCFALTANKLVIMESGVTVKTLSNVVLNDVLRISYEDTKIKYFVNNFLVYTSLKTPPVQIYAVAELRSSVTGIAGLRIYEAAGIMELSATTLNGGAKPVINWYVNNQLAQSSDSWIFSTGYLNSGDKISATLQNTDGCAAEITSSNEVQVKGATYAEFTLSDNEVCGSESVSAVVQNVELQPYANYQWYKNDVAMNGENQSALTITDMGTYKVVVNNMGCIKSSDSKQVMYRPVVNVTLPDEIIVCEGQQKATIQLTADQRTFLQLNGVDGAVSRSKVYNLKNNFTVEFWLNSSEVMEYKSQGTKLNRYVLHPNDGSATWASGHAGVGVVYGADGVTIVERSSNTAVKKVLTWNGVLSGWNHVAVVYNNNVPSLYINGNKVSTGVTSSFVPHLSYTLGGGALGYYKGAMDEVRIWNSVRNDGQILTNYNKQLQGNESGLVHYWMMDEAVGLAAQDMSPSKGHLSLSVSAGISWGGYYHEWIYNDEILENYGSRIIIDNASLNHTITVKSTAVGSTLCPKEVSTQIRTKSTQFIQVNEGLAVCAGRNFDLFAERFPYYAGLSGNIANTIIELPAGDKALSYSVWVKSDADAIEKLGVFSAGSMWDGMSAYIDAANKKLVLQSGSSYNSGYADEVDFSSYFGKWTHLTFVFGDIINPYRAIYINGTQVSKTASNNRGIYSVYGLNIGADFEQHYFKGYLRDFRLYTKVLSENDILALSKEQGLSAQHLLLHYPMTEGKGNTLTDKTGSSYSANISGDVIWKNDDSRFSSLVWTPGAETGHQISKTASGNVVYSVTGTAQSGCPSVPSYVTVKVKNDCPPYNAANFQTRDVAISAPFIADYEFNENDFTIEAKIKLGANDNGGAIISGRGGLGYLFTLFNTEVEAVLILQLNRGTYNNFYNVSSEYFPSLKDGQCHHVAVVRNQNVISFYLDGRSIGSTTISSGWGMYKKYNNTLYTGYDNSDRAFNGKIFETRMWNVARTSVELNSNISTRFTAAQSGLVADWSIEDYDGQLIYDRSKFGNTAYLGFSSSEDNSDPDLVIESCGFLAAPANAMENVQSVQNLESVPSASNILQALIYPNPTDESGTLLTVYGAELTSVVKVYNSSGMLLEEYVFENNTKHSILANQVSGVYFVQIQSGESVIVKRVVVVL
ncbi:MAG: LamG-like jellyroll fold domain-containing protein [Flavobacteriales bacterium]